jgi:hypothetical protein
MTVPENLTLIGLTQGRQYIFEIFSKNDIFWFFPKKYKMNLWKFFFFFDFWDPGVKRKLSLLTAVQNSEKYMKSLYPSVQSLHV